VQTETRWNGQTFALCLVINAIFIGAVYALILQGLPLAAVLLGGGGVASLLVATVAARQRVAPLPIAAGSQAVGEPPRAEPKSAEAPRPSAEPLTRAVQVLSLLQQKGRLIDFLQEDLGGYDDAQIGAAVRNIHEGCRQALSEMLKLEPVLKDEEGAAITVPAGFDPQAIRLTGNVVGKPPFTGVLRHRGWRTERVELPEQIAPANPAGKGFVLQAAEVEVEGRPS
jgi:hypothetical protein